MNYGPIITDTAEGRMLTAMGYHCRLAGKPATIDRQLPGLYNARKTSLQEWWAPVFGVRHGLIVLTDFRENVKRHDMEHRELKPGEEPENIVLQFNPRDHRDMLVPCLWDRWEQGGVVLNSFALITDTVGGCGRRAQSLSDKSDEGSCGKVVSPAGAHARGVSSAVSRPKGGRSSCRPNRQAARATA
jgi:hypothetical protein